MCVLLSPSAVVENKGFAPATLDSEIEGDIVKEDGSPVAAVSDAKPKVQASAKAPSKAPSKKASIP